MKVTSCYTDIHGNAFSSSIVRDFSGDYQYIIVDIALCRLDLTFAMAPQTLRENPSPDEKNWEFNVTLPATVRRGHGKHLSFSPQAIKFDLVQFPQNRILQGDDPSKFVLASFEQLRFADRPASTAKEYMVRLFQKGVFLNGQQYRFYGHSNSQLVRSTVM